MTTLLDKRLARLAQAHTPPAEQRERQWFAVRGYGEGDVGDFLISCGHDVRDGDVIRQIVSPIPGGGGPLVEPYVDITAEMRARNAR